MLKLHLAARDKNQSNIAPFALTASSWLKLEIANLDNQDALLMTDINVQVVKKIITWVPIINVILKNQDASIATDFVQTVLLHSKKVLMENVLSKDVFNSLPTVAKLVPVHIFSILQADAHIKTVSKFQEVSAWLAMKVMLLATTDSATKPFLIAKLIVWIINVLNAILVTILTNLLLKPFANNKSLVVIMLMEDVFLVELLSTTFLKLNLVK